MSIPFTSPRKEKLSSEIIRQIRAAILNGDFKQGDPLPTEKELLSHFGVSKHTIREALCALERMGFIHMKRGAGGGPMVRAIDWQTARDGFADFLHFQDISLTDISEARKLIEPYIARKAAECFGERELNELAATHEKCRLLVERKQNLVGAEAEVMFHVLLGKHSGNKVLWVMLDFMNSMLTEMKRAMRPDLDFSMRVQEAHQKILDAIKAKDPDAAEHYMRRHICEVEEGLKKYEDRLDKKP